MFSVLTKNKRFYIVTGAILLASFLFNIFGVGQTKEWFNDFEQYSQRFAYATVTCADEGKYKGNLIIPPEYIGGQKAGNPIKDSPQCLVYASQFGLQGYVYSVIPHISHSPRIQKVILGAVQLICALALAALLMAFVLFVHQQFGKTPAIVTWVFLALSDWLVGYAHNLYWLVFLCFAPIVFTLYAYPLVRRTTRSFYYFLGILGVLFLIKFLCGYEFFTVLALGSLAPIIYWESINGSSLKTIGRRCGVVLVAPIIAFLLAMGIQSASLLNDYQDIHAVRQAITERGEKRSNPAVSYRSTVLNFYKTSPEVYGVIDHLVDIDHYATGKGPDIVYFGLIITNYLSLPVISIPITLKGLLPIMLQSFAVWAIFTWVALRYIRRYRVIAKKQLRALELSLIVCAASVVSWPIAAAGHFYEHAHLDAIIFYLPFMLFSYATIAVAISFRGKRIWKQLTAK